MNIGPYAVISEIGRGGMGVVYKAQNPTNSQTVAIKMISGIQALDETHRMGLVREARTAGNLWHPNIVRVHDIGQHKGWLYLVMEYLEGDPLDRCIRSGPSLDIREKLSILIQLCNGLAYAESFGIVHRDIKPPNVFVLSDRAIKILDFGLAIGRDHNNANQFAGTVPYMSPEQLQRAELDRRSDVWSSGVTMYELLTGELPFKGRTLTEISEQVLFAPVPPLAESIPLRTELQAILARALAKNISDRYPSAKLFAADLETLRHRLPDEIAHTESKPETYAGSSSVRTDNGALLTTVTSYGGIDLKLRSDCSSTVSIGNNKFYMIKASRKLQDYRLRTNLVILTTISALPYVHVPIETVMLLLLCVGLPLIALWLPVLTLLETIDLLSHYPRCRSCSLPMLRASRWTRFVLTNSAVIMGYRDCIAALKENLWQDAAKLLCVHGAEPTFLFGGKLISTPLRYHLEFYECPLCSRQAARLTTDDLVEDQWQLRTEFTDAYRGASKRSGGALRKIQVAPRRFVDVWANVLRDARPGRILDMRVLAGMAAYVILLGSLYLYGRHEERRMQQLTQRQRQQAAYLSAEAANAEQEATKYYYGYGVPRDRQMAAHYYSLAASAGDGFSANQLGQMYENAIGLPQNFSKAAMWYQIGAREGNVGAIINLGRVYENGIGVPKDVERARYWYGLAARAGNQEAKTRLYKLSTK